MSTDWCNVSNIPPQKFNCKFCGVRVGSEKGYVWQNGRLRRIFICPSCDKPTFFEGNKQMPAPLLGNQVSHVPEDIETLYNEARACTSAGAYTAAVLVCRKLLMNIAVAQGAKEGLNFIEYVEHLAKKGYVPPNGEVWVDHIREKGNEANHEIALMTEENALDLITFLEMLLKFIYEFPGKIKKESPSVESVK